MCVVSYYKLVKDLVEEISKTSSCSTRFILLIFATQSFLAHLSRRLTGELIVYPYSVVRRRPSSTISKIFSSETAWPIKAKLHVEHP